jgi:hypothetical protein
LRFDTNILVAAYLVVMTGKEWQKQVQERMHQIICSEQNASVLQRRGRENARTEPTGLFK